MIEYFKRDVLSASEAASLLPSELDFLSFEMHECVDSTNTVARLRAEAGAPEGSVICASSQTAGRGRMGRAFFSPKDTGLYMSVLLRPKVSPALSSLITVAAAVSVTNALQEVLCLESGIKWVNDIFIDGRKVCGILTESCLSPDGSIRYTILGVGINVYEPVGSFPDELQSTAGSLVSAPTPGLKNRLCAAILKHFLKYYSNLEPLEFLYEYRRRSIVIGREVSVLSLSGEEKERAFAKGIDDMGNLVLRFPDGSERTMSSGEIRIRL